MPRSSGCSIEARVPIVVAAEDQGVGKSTTLGALLDFLPPDVRVVELSGEGETFDWLPQASELGWPGPRTRPATPTRSAPTRRSCWPSSSPTTRPPTPGARRRGSRSGRRRSATGLAATIHADSLDDVFDALRRPPVRLADDELSHLGVVLVLRRLDDGRRRVVAAHYVRPVARDVHGHLQRLGPAVLATWDPETDAFEHFGWGVTPELARRVGRHAGDFEIEVDRRRELLDRLVATGVTEPQPARDAIRAYRAGPHG